PSAADAWAQQPARQGAAQKDTEPSHTCSCSKNQVNQVMQPESQGAYAPAWKDHRLKVRIVWFECLVFLPAMLLIGIALRSTFLFLMCGFIGFAVVAIAASRAMSFCCPRCGKLFHFGRWCRISLARRCQNCGLPKWAHDEPAEKKEDHARVSRVRNLNGGLA